MSRRREIIQAALSCFVEHGVEGTKIEMICNAADVSVGNVYHHFGNKERLAAEVYISGLNTFQRTLVTALQPVTDIELGVRTVVYANIDWIVANPMWANFIFHHGYVLRQAKLQQQLNNESREANLQIWTHLQSLTGVAQIRPLPEEVLYSLMIAPVHDYAKRWLAGRCQISLEELREVFADAAWAAVSIR